MNGSLGPFNRTKPHDIIGHGHVLKMCPLSPQLLQNIIILTPPSSKLLFRFKQMSSQSYNFDPATITITVTSGSYDNPSIVHGGSGYLNGVTTFTLRGTLFSSTTEIGKSPENDVVVKFTNEYGVLSGGEIVSGTPVNDAISQTLSLEYNAADYIMRDASDITRALKERIIYNEKRAGSSINSGKEGSLVFGRPGVNPGARNNIPAGNAEMLWIPQGNQYRLSYLFGKLKCGAGSAGAFNLNGPLYKS